MELVPMSKLKDGEVFYYESDPNFAHVVVWSDGPWVGVRREQEGSNVGKVRANKFVYVASSPAPSAPAPSAPAPKKLKKKKATTESEAVSTEGEDSATEASPDE